MANDKAPKERLGFYTTPEFAQQVRECCFDFRLRLQDFFEEASRREMDRLKQEGTKKSIKRLPRGRPIRPKDEDDDDDRDKRDD